VGRGGGDGAIQLCAHSCNPLDESIKLHLVNVLADRTVPNSADAATQLQLIHDRVMPGLAAIGAEPPA
jgi:hypothetical protein